VLSGLVLLNKPGGITSFDAVRCIKKKAGTGKVGHAGTLDKFAEGLLIILIGKYTRLTQIVTGMDKTYEAVFILGIETDTLDPEGTCIGEGKIPALRDIEDIIPLFTGKILQQPPKYSAVHIQGKRAYAMARNGESFEIPERPVTIYSMEVLSYKPPELHMRIRCSKGTYIRSLARDMGIAAGTRGYVSRLKRTEIGPFLLGDAVNPDNFSDKTPLLKGRALFSLIPDITITRVKNENIDNIIHGSPLQDTFFLSPPGKDGIYALFSEEETLLAMAERRRKNYSYIFVGA